MYILLFQASVLRIRIEMKNSNKNCEITMRKPFYCRHKYLEFQKYVVCYFFDRALGTYGLLCSPPNFTRHKSKPSSFKYPCITSNYVPTKIVDIPASLFENVRFMKQIVSLFFMKAFYLEVLQKILTRNSIIFFTFLDSYYIKIYY